MKGKCEMWLVCWLLFGFFFWACLIFIHFYCCFCSSYMNVVWMLLLLFDLRQEGSCLGYAKAKHSTVIFNLVSDWWATSQQPRIRNKNIFASGRKKSDCKFHNLKLSISSALTRITMTNFKFLALNFHLVFNLLRFFIFQYI